MGTSARVICDSVSPRGDRLTTLEVTLHRFVLSEFNTHRAFSRNSASSRAIPGKKMRDRVREDRATPVVFPREQSGMQGGEELEQFTSAAAYEVWRKASMAAVSHAEALATLGVHKSVCNRLLEPFLWHTIIVTATDWDGFWMQRCSPLAQPEIRVAAEAMKQAYDASRPVPLDYGLWHTPFIRISDIEWATRGKQVETELLKQLSVARCARVSYLTHDGEHDPEKDIELYQRLVSADPPHASPLEHVATPTAVHELRSLRGNFSGWRQMRHDVLDF